MRITVSVPDDVLPEKAKAALERIYDPDWLALWWHIDDVKGRAAHCSDEELLLDEYEHFYRSMSSEDAQDILKELGHRHDANQGVTWDVIDHHVGVWLEEQREGGDIV
jgi:hypothetical protein